MSSDPSAKPIINISELATRLGWSRPTVYAWLRADKLPIAPIEGSKPPKWRAIDVERFLAGQDGA